MISKEVCNYIIKWFEKMDKLKKTYVGFGGKGTDTSLKDSTDINPYWDTDGQKWNDKYHLKIIRNYEKIIDNLFTEYFKKYHNGALNKLDFPSCEEIMHGPVIHRYKPPNQGYHVWHCDWGPYNIQASRRMVVGMLYLNDVEEGGETEFLHQKVKIKPSQGTVVVFPTYFTHVHRGNAPISNTKYIINKWGIV
jgi:hypothetical protein